MTFKKRLAAMLLAGAMAIGTFTVTAFATDPVGTNAAKLKEGKQASAQIKYEKRDTNGEYDNGINYKDFKITVPTSGTMILTFDVAVDQFNVKVFKDSNKQEIKWESIDVKTGNVSRWADKTFSWDKSAGLGAAVATYKVEKATYIVRISRHFFNDNSLTMWDDGKEGNGRVHIQWEMKKPDAPSDIKITKKSSNSFSLSWVEPNEIDSYEIRYRESNKEEWQTKKGIQDNKATVKNLKPNTKYSVQMRSKAGKIVGNWGKKFSVTTDMAGELTSPVFNNTVTVSWAEVDGSTSYNLNYSSDGKNWKAITSKTNSASFQVTNGVKYFYAVQAVSGNKKGPWSTTKTVTFG